LQQRFAIALNAIADSQHFDISSESEHLGRLYVFDVTEPELLAKGISKQWFLTHGEAGCVVSGHVSQQQQWSLSEPFSLEPTQQYVSQEHLLAKVFSDDYVESVRQDILPESTANGLLRVETELASNGSTDPMSGETGNGQQVRDSSVSQGLDSTGLSLEALPDSVPPAEDLCGAESSENGETDGETENVGTDDPSPQSQVPPRETARWQLEQQLAILLLEGEHQQLLDFQSIEPESLWQLEKEEDVLRLRDSSDEHIVMSVSSEGEILSRLSVEDAQAIVSQELAQSQSQSQPSREQPAVNTEKQKGLEL
jgi:hypothetical protein